MEMEFDVEITSGILYDYLMYHSYSRLSDLIGNIVGAILLIGGFVYGNIGFIIVGAIVLVYLPITLFVKSKQQKALNPAFKKPLHYKLNGEGVFVSQGGEEQMQKWEDMHKAISTQKSIVLYTSSMRAWIFPRKDLGTDVQKLIEIISVNMEPKKVRIRGYL